MKKYIKPDMAADREELMQILCDSLVGDAIDDFTDSEEIEW